jgi:ribosomal protein S18 acetylase RimI-like enzyme
MAIADETLDNPAWYALTNQQSTFALGDDRARRFSPDVAPFAAVVDSVERSSDSLAALIPSGEGAALIGVQASVLTEAFKLERTVPLVQMVHAGRTLSRSGDATPEITSLSLQDVPQMLELVDITHPGPFLPRTIELGSYLAVWKDSQLAAMAGERLHLPGYREISAVCTHPMFQRRGYARQLVLRLVEKMRDEGDTPILHVFSGNAGAIGLYESLGFERRAELTLYILRRL